MNVNQLSIILAPINACHVLVEIWYVVEYHALNAYQNLEQSRFARVPLFFWAVERRTIEVLERPGKCPPTSPSMFQAKKDILYRFGTSLG